MRNPIEEVDFVLAEGNEVVAGEDAAKGFGDGEAEVVASGVEAAGDLLVGVGDEFAEAVGRDGSEDGDGGGGDVGVGEVEVGSDAEADGLPQVRSEAGGANEIEGELLADGGGRGGHYLLAGGLGYG